MSLYYANFDLTTGLNNGTSAENAWQSMSAAIAGLSTGGNTVLCQGTDTLSAGLTLTAAQAGTLADGYNKWIGVNSSWQSVGLAFSQSVLVTNIPFKKRPTTAPTLMLPPIMPDHASGLIFCPHALRCSGSRPQTFRPTDKAHALIPTSPRTAGVTRLS